ncbi:MAG: hypothetical protein IJK81_11125 [Selenomonadaceae bacterium]|nr:hypothetical protein [Selenomonadaceae bacterium]
MKKFIISAVVMIILMTANALAANYVGNANSRKFHYADCSMVNKMNPANKVFMNTRDEAINAGYVPCKRCKP